jgi:hypothetical protein
MGRNSLVVFLLMTLMTSSLSGCLGLLQARETIEGLRDDVYEVSYPDKVSMTHNFDTPILLLPITNYTEFPIDESVTKIDIYFKVSFAFSDTVSCIDNFFTKEARYIEVEIATPSGIVFYQEDTCKDVPPKTTTFERDESFENGDWSLSIESRGTGEDFVGAIQDNWLIIVTVYRTCEQYPLEPPCDE